MPRSTDLQPRSPLLDTTPAVACRVLALAGAAAPAPARDHRPALRDHVRPAVAAEFQHPRRTRRVAVTAALGRLADPRDPAAEG